MDGSTPGNTIIRSALLILAPLAGLAVATPILEPVVWPPVQAYEACAQKKAGEVVSLETNDGLVIQAVCQTLHHALVAKPVVTPPQAKRGNGR